MTGNVQWPEWWNWEIEFSGHLLERMVDRHFNEVELRAVLDTATGYYKNEKEERRWVIETKHWGRPWEVIVQPDTERQVLRIVTAYPL